VDTSPPPPQLPSPFLDLENTGDEELETQICSFASRIAAAMCLFLLAVAEYDRRESWRRWECRSMVHWLSWRCAISPGVAAQYCRTAAALTALPTVTSRFAVGELSYSQVRAICRVATPQSEAMLVELARDMTAAQLEKVVASYQQVKAVAEQTAEERDRRRTLTWNYDDDGSVTGVFRMPPEDAAVFIKAIQERTVTFDPTGSDNDSQALDPVGARRVDALVDLAAADLDQRAAGETADPGDHYLVTIVADATVLRPDTAGAAVIDVDVVEDDSPDMANEAQEREPEGPVGHQHDEPNPASEQSSNADHSAPTPKSELCEVAGGPGLAPSTVQRLLCGSLM
jgi:hypothetical protein